MKKEVLQLRQSLQASFRKNLSDLDEAFAKKAFEALSEDMKSAMNTTQQLKDELALQSEGIRELAKHQQKNMRDVNVLKGQLKELESLTAANTKEMSKLHEERLLHEAEMLTFKQNYEDTMKKLKSVQRQKENLVVDSGGVGKGKTLATSTVEDLEWEIERYALMVKSAEERKAAWERRLEELQRVTGLAFQQSSPLISGGQSAHPAVPARDWRKVVPEKVASWDREDSALAFDASLEPNARKSLEGLRSLSSVKLLQWHKPGSCEA